MTIWMHLREGGRERVGEKGRERGRKERRRGWEREGGDGKEFVSVSTYM